MKQRTFFDEESFDLINWENDDKKNCWIAKVVFATGLDGIFDYRIPDHLLDRVKAGQRLLVPLGKANRPVVVYCISVELKSDSLCSKNNLSLNDSLIDQNDSLNGNSSFAKTNQKSFALKYVLEIIDERPLLSPKMILLTQWISERYLCPLGLVLDAVLPAGVRDQAGTRLTAVYTIIENADQKIFEIQKINDSQKIELLTPKQRYVFEILQKAEEPMTLSELTRMAKCSTVPINKLKKLGLLKKLYVRRQSHLNEELLMPVPRTKPLVLNADQTNVLNLILMAIRQQKSQTFLLHGVTGSGKTEVYIQAINEIVSYGKQAIVLVPEISLTPQTVNRFKQRFDNIAVLHSHLTDSERHFEWNRIASGKVQVVIGARSAIFAPLPHLGLIIIDEEHENSFKQDVAPRYHAREVAEFRAKQENIPLILGSATPALESWFRQETGEYQLLSLPRRVLDLPLPKVQIVDLRSQAVAGFTRGAIHQYLFQGIKEALRHDGQIILFLNRRGYSTHIQCPACGEVLKCPDCDVALTHHLTQQIALCHYCDYQIPAPSKCPKCGFFGIRYSGFGTQRLQQELEGRFPNVPVLRMDTDTMQGHGTHERALESFRDGQYRILVGTQMIAKGLHFPNVTLVGVINADTALHLPDFRAAERTFHLITQVAGRTGRGEKGGKVIVQTFSPDEPAIIAASSHNYRQFVQYELQQRKGLGYPPYSTMIRLVIRGPNELETIQFAKQLAQEIQLSIQTVNELLQQNRFIFSSFDRNRPTNQMELKLQAKLRGPAPAPFVKLRGNYRFHIQILANDPELIRGAFRLMSEKKMKTPTDVQWIVDVDPLDML
ncbi:MAG: primosomal protein N' [Planctomycetia bacterium]|nr:primosomal protein N' [Planctomycetia bacterium]